MVKRDKATNKATIGFGAALLLSGAVTAAVQADAFTPGDILVSRVIGGTVDTTQTNPNGVAPITAFTVPTNGGTAGTVEIDEYAPGNFATPVMSITMPNVQQATPATGTVNYALTLSGTQTQEGSLLNSGNGEFFSLAGYNQTAGIAGTNASNSTVVQRVVGLISLNGTVNTTTGLTDTSSAVSFRSAYTSDGTNIWVNGATKANNSFSGVHYATVGSTTSAQITAADPGAGSDILGAFNFGSGPQLLLSNIRQTTQASPPTSAAFLGIAAVGDATQGPGAGLPTSSASPTTTYPVQLSGFSNTTTLSNTTLVSGETADNFWFQNATTVFIADNRSCSTVANTTSSSAAFGGVQKWVEQDTDGDGKPDTWVFQYNVPLGLGETSAGSQTAGGVGAHGLAGTVDPKTGLATLYVTTFDPVLQNYTGTDGSTVTGFNGGNRNDLYAVQDTGTSLTIANGGLPLTVSGANDGANGIVGMADSAFRGVAIVPNFINGDANLDGHVDLTDLSIVLNNFGSTTNSWALGNFDGASTVDLTDLSDVLNNFGASLSSGAASPGVAAAPEPASLAVLGLGVAGFLIRRRRA